MRYLGAFQTLLLILLIATFAGCADRRSAEEKRSTLVYGYGDPFKSFDPARQVYSQETVIMNQVLEGLVRWNNDLVLEGHLATDWATNDGCRTWEFNLRPGVVFHDGTPFDSTAVRLHFERILDPATAATRRKLIEDLLWVETPEPLRVIFHLQAPNCIFPERLASAFAYIPSPASIAAHNDTNPRTRRELGLHPIGTGPFRFVDWEPDVRIRLARWEQYWNRDLIHVEQLHFVPVREHTTRLILLEQGRLDMAPIFFAHKRVADRTEDIEVQSIPQLAIVYIGFNTQKPPFSDPRVRRAANYAINKDDIVKYGFFGAGSPAKGPLPHVLPDFNADIEYYDYNPERARALLTEAGYPQGIRVTMWTQETGTYRIASDAIIEQLRQVGIRVNVNVLDNAVYWDKFDEFLKNDGTIFPTKEGVYDMFVGGWVGGEVAHGYLEPLFKGGSYSNATFYDNPVVNAGLVEFKALPDEEDRRAVYRRLQKVIVEDAPWIFTLHMNLNIGVRRHVKGFRINPSGRLFFEGVRLMTDEEGAP